MTDPQIEQLIARLVPRLVDELERRGMLRIEFGSAALGFDSGEPGDEERQSACNESRSTDRMSTGTAGELKSISPKEADARRLVERLRLRVKHASSNAPSSERSPRPKNADALRAKAEELRQLADNYAAEADRRDGRGLTLGEAMERYKAYMLHDKGNKPRSVETTGHRLIKFLGDPDAYLTSITERKAAELYEARRKKVAVDTHRNELGQTKTFMNWCVEEGWLRRNPFARVKGVGKRNQGKEQLRLEETRKLVTVALAEARLTDGEIRNRRDAQHRESALAVLVALYLALRAGELVNIERRDVDDRGRLLWIPDSKTDNGRRTLEVADVLRPLLWRRARVCAGQGRRSRGAAVPARPELALV